MSFKKTLFAFLISSFLFFPSFGQKSDDFIDLNDWQADNRELAHLWKVESGVLTGGDGIQKIPKNTFWRSVKEYKDFEFSALFRLTGDDDLGLINSGIQYRSILKEGKMIGYQADIGNGYWGDIYDEHRRGKLRGGDVESLKILLKEDGWNSYLIRCQGNKHELYINGIKTNEYVETKEEIPSKGIIGIQLHSGGNAQIELKHVRISEL